MASSSMPRASSSALRCPSRSCEKLLIHQETHQILGVHAIGTNATELIHIGQAVMAFNGTVDYFINNVFNFPTLAEAYKVAALNGLNKLRHV